MTNALKMIIAFLVLTTGCTVITEASYFRCYYKTMDNYVEYQSRDIAKMMDAQPYYTKNIRTFMWVHGFNATMTGRAITTIVNGALAKGGWNVCAWNWVEEASAPDLVPVVITYSAKLPVVKEVGLEMANSFIEVKDMGFNLSSLFAYAHSIGAHVMGECGRNLKKENLVIEWIFGLDNAGPLYYFFGENLSKDDGKNVICLHTDPGNKGTNSSRCLIDIWANLLAFLLPDKPARVQTDCPENVSTTDMSINGTCSHDFSWKLITAAFFYVFPISYSPDYWTWARSNGTAMPVTQLGENINTTYPGNYYLRTLGVNEYPYTLGMDGLRPN